MIPPESKRVMIRTFLAEMIWTSVIIACADLTAFAQQSQPQPQTQPVQTQPAQSQPATTAPQPQPPPQPAALPDELILREALVIGHIGQFGRAPVQIDAIQSQLVRGQWTRPKAGDVVTLPDGSAHAWTAVTAAEDGQIQNEALQSGYALFTLESPEDRIMLLHARGDYCAYINGELRTGDPYSLGFVMLPVHIRKGANELLFQCTRGQLAARLIRPKASIILHTADMTLPDLIAGQPVDAWGSLVVINATDAPTQGLALLASQAGQPPTAVPVPPVSALGVRKIAFHLQGPALPAAPPPEGPTQLDIKLELQKQDGGTPQTLDTAEFALSIFQPNQLQKRTFISEIDGSVQYFALRPADPIAPGAPAPGLILSLHGAAVEAAGQAAAYASKPWCHIVAPTNRRPFGFDWEDWGRLDALEVLAIAQRDLKPDPQHIWLSGHSMGGHGTWNLGALFPDRFAAIGPSAGWISFWSYAGATRPDHPSAMADMLLRASQSSDTLALTRNYLQQGIYILHGDQDDNVPVGQARQMRQHLATFHPDFAYHEQPGAGHWWGGACVDWPPMMEFFQHHALPADAEVNHIEFHTPSPGVSASCHWATIEAQTHDFVVSSIDLHRDPAARTVTGTTTNVARLSLSIPGTFPGAAPADPGKPFAIELDSQKLGEIPSPVGESRIWFTRTGDTWAISAKPAPAPAPGVKSPTRSGPFKDAFRNRMLFIYGTTGTPEENAWSLQKARFDAETFWYRGNGSIDVIPDSAFDPAKEPNRNIILYGNADTNAAWKLLLGDSPVQVNRGTIKIANRDLAGDDLACLFIRPRPGSDTACVAAVSGSGLIGMRLTDRIPYFVSGVGYPDCIVIGAESLLSGNDGVRVAGFFANDWSIPSGGGDFVWRETEATKPKQ